MTQVGEGHKASKWPSGHQSLQTVSEPFILSTFCCWLSGESLALGEFLVGDLKRPAKQGFSSPSAHPRRQGPALSRTHLSCGWAGSGPGRLASSSAVCSRCHGGLRESRNEDPWIPTATSPYPGVGLGRGINHPLPGTWRWAWKEAEETHQSYSAPQGHRVSPVSASCPRRSCLFRRHQGHTK